MTLAVAVDSAYPFDFTQRPTDCEVIMGYVGRDGYTPHVWTLSEVATARATGCQWWPIGVGISRGATNAQDGHDLASVMIARLPGYGVSKTTPVFQDLEPDALRADPAGAAACVAAWKADMHAAGYPNAYTYSLDAPFIDWIANWINVRPTQLPPGKIGWQYGGAQSPPAYDISVFDPTLLTFAGGDDDMNDADWVKMTALVRGQLVDYFANGEGNPRTGRIVQACNTSLQPVKTSIGSLPTTAQVAAIVADSAVDQVALERAVVDAIADALAGGVPVETIEQGVANAIANQPPIPVTLTGHAGNPPVTP